MCVNSTRRDWFCLASYKYVSFVFRDHNLCFTTICKISIPGNENIKRNWGKREPIERRGININIWLIFTRNLVASELYVFKFFFLIIMTKETGRPFFNALRKFYKTIQRIDFFCKFYWISSLEQHINTPSWGLYFNSFRELHVLPLSCCFKIVFASTLWCIVDWSLCRYAIAMVINSVPSLSPSLVQKTKFQSEFACGIIF